MIFFIRKITLTVTNFLARSSQDLNSFYLGLLLGLVLEELIFRLPLILTRINLLVSLAMPGYLVFRLSEDKWNVLGAVTLVFIASSFTIDKILGFLRAIPFGFYFYALAVAFGYLHLTNYMEDGPDAETLNPFWYLPHIEAGLILSFVRLMYGMVPSIAMHSWNNFFPFC
jgi:hypothetical protein